MRVIACTVLLMSALASCSTPPLTFTVPQVTANHKRHNAALVSTIVTLASKNESKGRVRLAGMETDVSGLWKSAVEDAVIRSGTFDDSASKRLSLVIKVTQFKASGIGSHFNTTAQYELIDRNKGGTVFKIEISEEGSASDYNGNNRVRTAANRATSQNIAKFLEELDKVDL